MRPRSGSAPEVAPEIVVVQFLGRGGLEAVDLAALGIDARHDVLDHAVLAGRVHGLEDDEQSVLILGVEHVLVSGQRLDAFGQEFVGIILFDIVGGVAGIEVLL